MTLAGSFRRESNSLNVLRLVLAGLVVVSHAPLAGHGSPPYRLGGLDIGGWAVAAFFAISGWLVTESRIRLALWHYLWRRCIRIFPGFWVALLVTAFVFAPVATRVGGSWNIGSAFTYVGSNLGLVIRQPGIANTLHDSPYQTVWNLSLWTLAWEFACYLGIGFIWCVPVFRQRWWTLAAFAAVTAAQFGIAVGEPGWASHGMATGLRLVSFFLAGAVLLRFGSDISARGSVAVAAAAALVMLAALGKVAIFGALPLAYLAIWLACRLPFVNWGRTYDLSFGLYIYAFPIQQLLSQAGIARAGAAAYLGLTAVVVVPIAAGSWILVERPALRWRTRWDKSSTRYVTAASS